MDRIKQYLLPIMTVVVIVAFSILFVVNGVKKGSLSSRLETSGAKTTEYSGYTEYKVDYKTGSLNTKMTAVLNDEVVTIQGNIFRVVTDPLTMTNKHGTTLAYATDQYDMFSEDDHMIIVDNIVDCIMQGDFNIAGKTYTILNSDGEHIANFERIILTSTGADITDKDGKLIAKYSRVPLMNDFKVIIYDNDVLSDESILMIMSSFVSDQKYEDNKSRNTNKTRTYKN